MILFEFIHWWMRNETNCFDVTKNIFSVFPNCVYKSKVDRKRVYVSDEIAELNDHSALYLTMPFERGYLGVGFLYVFPMFACNFEVWSSSRLMIFVTENWSMSLSFQWTGMWSVKCGIECWHDGTIRLTQPSHSPTRYTRCPPYQISLPKWYSRKWDSPRYTNHHVRILYTHYFLSAWFYYTVYWC